jgi:hypothetical protein
MLPWRPNLRLMMLRCRRRSFRSIILMTFFTGLAVAALPLQISLANSNRGYATRRDVGGLSAHLCKIRGWNLLQRELHFSTRSVIAMSVSGVRRDTAAFSSGRKANRQPLQREAIGAPPPMRSLTAMRPSLASPGASLNLSMSWRSSRSPPRAAFAALPAKRVCGTVQERFFLEEAGSPEGAEDSVRYRKLVILWIC